MDSWVKKKYFCSEEMQLWIAGLKKITVSEWEMQLTLGETNPGYLLLLRCWKKKCHRKKFEPLKADLFWRLLNAVRFFFVFCVVGTCVLLSRNFSLFPNLLISSFLSHLACLIVLSKMMQKSEWSTTQKSLSFFTSYPFPKKRKGAVLIVLLSTSRRARRSVSPFALFSFFRKGQDSTLIVLLISTCWARRSVSPAISGMKNSRLINRLAQHVETSKMIKFDFCTYLTFLGKEDNKTTDNNRQSKRIKFHVSRNKRNQCTSIFTAMTTQLLFRYTQNHVSHRNYFFNTAICR